MQHIMTAGGAKRLAEDLDRLASSTCAGMPARRLAEWLFAQADRRLAEWLFAQADRAPADHSIITLSAGVPTT